MMGKRRLLEADSPIATIPAQIERPQMLHPSDSELQRILAVRDGHAAPVTCASCGCRLVVAGEVGFHFSPLGGRDARGCRVTCADAAHDLSGRPLLA
jgi:hypothetical protein